jgi:predicted DNA-binding transcriptional regulator AlpA
MSIPNKQKSQITSSVPATNQPIHQSVFDALPDCAFVREAQLVRKPKYPKFPAPLPFSAPTLWRMVRAQTFPTPVRLSNRVTAWKVGDVRAWMITRQMADCKVAT